MEQLQKMGIQIGFLISGLFGSILMATKNDKTDFKSVVLSLVGGMSAANFLTPVLVDTLNIVNVKHQNGVAFIAGFLGLKLVELVSEKFLEKVSGTQKKKTPKRKPKKS
jgi:uncharacterized membrane protein YeaQ/YmgE (transglycosylase-associated protein family)